jgi:phage portal protein BeeE
LVGGAIYSPDEARARFDKKPVPGGNSPYLQQQNYSLAALAKRDAQADPFATGTSVVPANANASEEDIAAAKQIAVWKLKSVLAA